MKIYMQALALGLATVSLSLLLTSRPATADNVFSVSTMGVQPVLVIPIEFPGPPGDPCPDKNTDCPVDPTWFAGNVGPPRHTAGQWESLLNQYARGYWQRTSYNQLDFQFTVLSNPTTDNGWWPAPRSLQAYSRNTKGGNWNFQPNTPASYPIVPDVTASVVQSLCSNFLTALVFCGPNGVLSHFSRLLVITNFHGFGAQTVAAIGGGVYALGIDTGTSVGHLAMTASIANEDAVDDGVTSMIHELGHQLGHLAHYGDCSKYLIYPVAGPAECLDIGWDIMGFSYSVAHETAYSKVSRGYIDPASTITLDLLGGPFSQSYVLGPLELPPARSPTVLRLSLGDPSWPEYLGYYAECRIKVNGDEGVSTLPSTLGLSREGLLVTSVHEFSTTDLFYPAPAHHIARPVDQPGRVDALSPGEVFTDPSLGVSVRFDGFVGQGAFRSCAVSVANNELLPVNLIGRIRFAGNISLAGGAGKTGIGSIPSDIAVGTVLPHGSVALGPYAQGQLVAPVTPPWVGHGNLIAVRVHNRSPAPVSNVQTALTVQSPAVITNGCHMAPSVSANASFGQRHSLTIAPGSSTQWSTVWSNPANRSDSADSVGIELTAHSAVDDVGTASRFAFAHFRANATGEVRRLHFVVSQSARCPGPATLSMEAGPAPEGWSAVVTPQFLTLEPGHQSVVTVTVTPPSGAAAGMHAEIPVTVAYPMVMSNRVPGLSGLPGLPPGTNAATPLFAFSQLYSPGVHMMGVGALTVLGRVTGGPGELHLAAGNSDRSARGQRMVYGTLVPGEANEPLTLEYISDRGSKVVHVVYTTTGGAFTDVYDTRRDHDDSGDDDREHARHSSDDDIAVGSEASARSSSASRLATVQAHWAGDNAHDPTDSEQLTMNGTRRVQY